MAAEVGKVKNIKLLLQRGANIHAADKHGQTSLFIAVSNGQEEAVILLISYGADINIRNKRGDTPLSVVVQQGKTNIAQLLLAYGVAADNKLRSHLFSKDGLQNKFIFYIFNNNLKHGKPALVIQEYRLIISLEKQLAHTNECIDYKHLLTLAIVMHNTYIALLLLNSAQQKLGEESYSDLAKILLTVAVIIMDMPVIEHLIEVLKKSVTPEKAVEILESVCHHAVFKNLVESVDVNVVNLGISDNELRSARRVICWLRKRASNTNEASTRLPDQIRFLQQFPFENQNERAESIVKLVRMLSKQ